MLIPHITRGTNMGSTSLALLEEMRDVGAIETLLRVARDDNERLIQIRAVVVIGKTGVHQTCSRLEELFAIADDPQFTGALLYSLGECACLEVSPLVKSFLSHPDVLVRLQAAKALAQFGTDQGEITILEGTYNDNPLVKKRATIALGFLDTVGARARIDTILDDPNSSWRSYARIALVQQKFAHLNEIDQIAELQRLTGNSNALVARWAMEQLAERPAGHHILWELSADSGKTGIAARRLLVARGIR